MGITNFDHYTTRTCKFEESYNFYKNILGLPTEMNPNIPFRIAVVVLADNVHHHLMEMGPGIDEYVGVPVPYFEPGEMDESNIGTMAASRTTNFDHLTFRGTGFDEVAARFKAANYPYLDNVGFIGTGAPSPDRPRRWRVLQCMDPDGVKISINFEGE